MLLTAALQPQQPCLQAQPYEAQPGERREQQIMGTPAATAAGAAGRTAAPLVAPAGSAATAAASTAAASTAAGSAAFTPHGVRGTQEVRGLMPFPWEWVGRPYTLSLPGGLTRGLQSLPCRVDQFPSPRLSSYLLLPRGLTQPDVFLNVTEFLFYLKSGIRID